MKTIYYFNPKTLHNDTYITFDDTPGIDDNNPYYIFLKNSITEGYINKNELNKIRNLLNDWYDTLNNSEKLLLEIGEGENE